MNAWAAVEFALEQILVEVWIPPEPVMATPRFQGQSLYWDKLKLFTSINSLIRGTYDSTAPGGNGCQDSGYKTEQCNWLSVNGLSACLLREAHMDR